MIKKSLKTLDEFKNPKPEPRWRIHLDDGSHIDVTGELERTNTIIQLVRNGRISATGVDGVNTLNVQNLSGAQNITVNVTVERTEVNTTFKQLLKEDFLKWSWTDIFLIPKIWLLLSYITAFTKFGIFIFLFILMYLTVGLINFKVVDKIGDFIGPNAFTQREHKILKTILFNK